MQSFFIFTKMGSRFGVILIFIFLGISNLKGQNSYLDPAEAYNKLVTNKSSDQYIRIGNFKVTGTPYLFGEELLGIIYSNGSVEETINLKYNTYTSQIELKDAASGKILLKDITDVDSFVLLKNDDVGLTANMKFINSKYVSPQTKYFLSIVERGIKIAVYKTYKSILKTVSTNYVQRDLREFDLEVQYWYAENSFESLVKLKNSYSGIYKEFNKFPGISDIFTPGVYTENPDSALKQLVKFLNR